MGALRQHTRVLLLLVLSTGGWLHGCAVNPVTGQADFVLMSEDQELTLGQREHPKILKQYGRYPDEHLQSYVQRIGRELATHSHRRDLVYHFTVLDSTEVNAFALPGGYVYITRGLLAYLNSEAQLAAVLGHEIGHVTARHSVRQYSAATATQMGYTIGALLVPELRAQGARDLFDVMGTALIRGYGREHELEADRLGAQYLARVGYDPKSMIKVITVLKNQEAFELQLAKEEGRAPRLYHGIFATHPDNDQRLHEVVGEAQALKQGAPTRPANRDGFLTYLEGLTFGPGARDGVLRGRHFYHRDLDITVSFPAKWKVDNRPDRLVASAPGQAALLQLTVEKLKGHLSPKAFLAARLGEDALKKGAPIRAGGLEGYSAIARLNTPYGPRDSRVTVLFLGDRAYLFAGAAKDDARRKVYDPDFRATAANLRTMTREERALAEPLKLHLLRAKPGATFAGLARTSRIPHHAEEQLRLLNSRYPKGEPEAGERTKVLQ